MRHATTFSGPVSIVHENSFFLESFGLMHDITVWHSLSNGLRNGLLTAEGDFSVLKFSSHFTQSIDS